MGSQTRVPQCCSATGGCVSLGKLLVCPGPSPLLCKGDHITISGEERAREVLGSQTQQRKTEDSQLHLNFKLTFFKKHIPNIA